MFYAGHDVLDFVLLLFPVDYLAEKNKALLGISLDD